MMSWNSILTFHFTGYLDDERKTDVMRHAAGVIFPNFSEGFAIPIVEGALFGRPVICSNLRVFHEVTRTQALYFGPNSPDELAIRINEVLTSPAAYAESARRLREIVLERFSQQAMRRRLQQTLSEIAVLKPFHLDDGKTLYLGGVSDGKDPRRAGFSDTAVSVTRSWHLPPAHATGNAYTHPTTPLHQMPHPATELLLRELSSMVAC
jgi:Glycosyl transferases group 1